MAADMYMVIATPEQAALARAAHEADQEREVALAQLGNDRSLPNDAFAAADEAFVAADKALYDALYGDGGRDLVALHLGPARPDGPRLTALVGIAASGPRILDEALLTEFTRAFAQPNTSRYWRNSYHQRWGRHGMVTDHPRPSATSPRRHYARGPVRQSDLVRFWRQFRGSHVLFTIE